MKYVKNFARFYALLKQLPGVQEGTKESLVSNATDGRTTHLHLMYPKQYEAMCNRMQGIINPNQVVPTFGDAGHLAELKRRRSIFLNHIQKYCNVDTSEWANVDNYCLSTKGIGKVFKKLTIEELKAAVPQIHARGRKRSIKQSEIAKPTSKIKYLIMPANGLVN